MASIARANETLVCRGKKWFRGTDIYRQSELDHRGDKQSITIKSQDAQAEVQDATINSQRARLPFVILPKRKLVIFCAGLLPRRVLLLLQRIRFWGTNNRLPGCRRAPVRGLTNQQPFS